MKVRIPLTLTWVESNLSPAEEHPQIKCFLDGRFDREAVTLQLEREGQTHKVDVEGTLLSAEGAQKSAQIPPTTSLCFASFAWRPNDTGSPCLQDTGVAYVTFGEIAQGIAERGAFDKEVPLLMHTFQGYYKGKVRLQIPKIEGVRFDNHIAWSVGQDTEMVPLINGYINGTLEVEQRMPETFPGTENMRIPFDYSEAGIQTTLGTPLPVISFAMTEMPKSNLEYWRNALRVNMERDGLKPEDWSRLNLMGKARIMALIAGYAIQYMDYRSDTIDRNTRARQYSQRLVQAGESFSVGLDVGSLDCEDGGNGIDLTLGALVQFSFPPQEAVLREIQQIGRAYLSALSLDVVRGAQVADQVEHFGAHLNDNLPPDYKFRQWIERSGREGRKFTQTLPAPVWDPKTQGELPFLVGEGTGMYEPYGYEHPLLHLMGYVYRAPSLAGFKKPIMHKKGEPGSFFVGSLVGITNYYYKRGSYAPIAFWYCNKQGSRVSRGVSYEDMMNDRDNVAIKVQPMVPKAMMPTIIEAGLRRVPPAPLTLTPGVHERRKHNSVLERVSNAVEGFRRTPGSPHDKVPVYIRPHQLNATSANAMIADFSRLERVWKVDYHLEEITDKTWGYRMEIFVS